MPEEDNLTLKVMEAVVIVGAGIALVCALIALIIYRCILMRRRSREKALSAATTADTEFAPIIGDGLKSHSNSTLPLPGYEANGCQVSMPQNVTPSCEPSGTAIAYATPGGVASVPPNVSPSGAPSEVIASAAPPTPAAAALDIPVAS